MYLPPLCCAASVLLTGCASVHPEADYRRANRMVADRTGVEEVYDPATEAVIDQKVQGLLAGGLTVEEAVQCALLNNKGFQALFHDIGASRADVVQSGLLVNPSLSLSLRFPEGGGRSDLTMGFAQELVDLWQIPIRKRIAQQQLEQAVLTVARRAIELAAEVKVKCYRLLALQRAERVAQENLKLVERSWKLAQDRFGAGEVGRLDVNLARANLLDVKRDLISLGRDRRVAKAALAEVLGLARRTDSWELSGSLPPPGLVEVDGTQMVLRAMRERLDARVAALQVHAAEQELRRQYRKVFPSVTVGMEAERLEARALPGRKILADTARESVAGGGLTAPGIQSRGERALERRQIIDWLLGPTVDVTLPVWDQNQAQIAKARFQVQQRRKQYEQLLDSVAQQVNQALVEAQTGQELVRFYDGQMLPQARANVEVARRAYRAGEQSILALIEAQRSLLAQQQQYVQAVRDYAVATAELERAVGGRLPPTTTTRPSHGGEAMRGEKWPTELRASK